MNIPPAINLLEPKSPELPDVRVTKLSRVVEITQPILTENEGRKRVVSEKEPEIDTSEVEKFYKAKADTFRTKRMGFWETGDFDKGDVSAGIKEPSKEGFLIEKLKKMY